MIPKTDCIAVMIILVFTLNTIFLSAQPREENFVSESTLLNAETDICSRYYYKGVALSSGPVLQPGFSLSAGNLTAGVWGSLGRNDGRPFTLCETDIYASYEFSLSSITFNNKLAAYLYPEAEGYPDTGEYILLCSVSNQGITAFSEVSIDLIAYRGAFVVTHGAAYSRSLFPGAELESTLSVSWAGSRYNGVNYGVEKTAMNCAQADLGLIYSMQGGVYLNPHFHYFFTIDKELRGSEKYGVFYFGLKAGYNL